MGNEEVKWRGKDEGTRKLQVWTWREEEKRRKQAQDGKSRGRSGRGLQYYKTTIHHYFRPTYLTMTLDTTKKAKKTIFQKYFGRTDGWTDRHSKV